MNIPRTSLNNTDVLKSRTRERVVNTLRSVRVPPVPTKALTTTNMTREIEIV